MSATQPRLAVDIETVSPNVPPSRTPQFDDSQDFEVYIVGVGHQPEPGAPIETEAIFRDSWGPEAELDVIETGIKWCERRGGDALLSYNGDEFDFIHLEERARIAANELEDRHDVGDRVKTFLNDIESDDVKQPVWDAFGEYTRFEEACDLAGIDVPRTLWQDYDHGLDPNDHRRTEHYGADELVSADVAEFGEQYLDVTDDA